MHGPPSLKSERAAPPKAAPKPRAAKQQQPYMIRADVQVFIAALPPMSFSFLCLLTSWGVQR
jgi:hypothetical protein